ncbi:MAG: septum formation initiator family protein [Candidatus Pacebacteria bacterium]|nr:septum formation initiator family protein [Candidatus Paceibacterota bacterium]
MKDFQRKSKNGVLYSLPVLALFFVILVLFATGIIDFANKAKDAYENRKIAEEKISELKERKTQLESDIGELNTDLGKERVFRENYGLGKPGEKVIIVVENTNKENPEESTKTGFFDYFMDLFD